MAGRFDELVGLIGGNAITFKTPSGRLAVCPTLTGRVYAEVGGRLLHRIEMDTVANPDKPFNNFGGNNLWPAPEGGVFAFNYRGDAWCVQPCINAQAYRATRIDPDGVVIEKEVVLTNRAGIDLRVRMTRDVRLTDVPESLSAFPAARSLSYTVRDSLAVLNDVPATQALIAAWTLEQFDATPGTISFGIVEKPGTAINFDFYTHPGERIVYRRNGFTYRTDGHARGQIGIPAAAKARAIGFYDLTRGLLCLRRNENAGRGLYFNMADNAQPRGPYSAADAYSIFNSDPDMRAFELETVGGADIERGRLRGSELVSSTTFLQFNDGIAIAAFLARNLGPAEGCS